MGASEDECRANKLYEGGISVPRKQEMLKMNDPEKIMDKDLAKKRVNLLKEFNLSRDAFVVWYAANINPVVAWTNPVTAWMFAAWVHGCNVDEWRTEKEQAAYDARQAAIAARRAAQQAKEEAEREAREAKKAADAAARAEAEVKRAALTAKRAALKKERRSVNEQVNS